MMRPWHLYLWGVLGAAALVGWSICTIKVARTIKAHDLVGAEFYLAVNRSQRSLLRASVHFDTEACTGFVRVITATASNVNPESEFENFGPDSFHIRVAGPEILAIDVDAVHHLGAGVYETGPFSLRRPGGYAVQLWHLYENFTAWTMGGEHFPAALPEYMRLHDSAQARTTTNHTLWPPFHAGNIECTASQQPARPGAPPAAQRPCKAGEHVPGRWVRAAKDGAQAHSFTNAFEVMEYSDVEQSHMLQYLPDACTLPTLDSAQSLRCLRDGGLGADQRAALRRIAIVGDSNLRTLANGFYFALGNSTEFNHTRYHHHDSRVYLPKTVYGNTVSVEYCEARRLNDEELAQCGHSLVPGPDDVLVAGCGSWPLSTVGGWPIMLPGKYRTRLKAFREEWEPWLAQHPAKRVLWLTTTAPPLYFHDAIRDNVDHRNSFRYWRYNQIAKDVFRASAIEVVDVFSLSLPVNNLSWDRAHYDSAVLRETINIVINALCRPHQAEPGSTSATRA